MDWTAIALAHWEQINALAVRRFGRGPLAEEAALAVVDGLIADDGRRLRAHTGRASQSAYILAVSARLLEDFARRRHGRPRPPLWVKALGGIWDILFRALCLERLPVVEAVEMVHQRHFRGGGDGRINQSALEDGGTARKQKDEIETAAFSLLARIPDCGSARGLEVELDVETEAAAADGGPGGTAEQREKRLLLEAIYHLVLAKDGEPPGSTVAMDHPLPRVNLEAEDRLLLGLCYRDGMGVAEAGRLLGMNRFQAHGRLRRALERVKIELDRSGWGEALRAMLEE